MKKKKLPIRWDRLAKENLDTIYDYIAEDSVASAQKVKKTLVKLARSLSDFPEKFPKENYLVNESENYRSITKWSYKIIYEVTKECIIIADVFHVSQHPSKMMRKD